MRLSPFLRAARRLARPEARRFAARAWLAAPLVRASLALGGLRATIRWVEALPPARRARPVGVDEGSALVGGAFRAHVVGGECLPRSLVQYLLHRRDGLPVRLVLGVKRPGDHASAIAAHAWVEAGEPGSGDPAFTPLFVTGTGSAA